MKKQVSGDRAMYFWVPGLIEGMKVRLLGSETGIQRRWCAREQESMFS